MKEKKIKLEYGRGNKAARERRKSCEGLEFGLTRALGEPPSSILLGLIITTWASGY